MVVPTASFSQQGNSIEPVRVCIPGSCGRIDGISTAAPTETTPPALETTPPALAHTLKQPPSLPTQGHCDTRGATGSQGQRNGSGGLGGWGSAIAYVVNHPPSRQAFYQDPWFCFRWLLKGFASKRSIRIPGRVVPLRSDRALPRERLPEPFCFRWLLKGFASKLQNAQRELKMRPHVDSMPSLETKVSGANPGNAFQNRSVSVGF